MFQNTFSQRTMYRMCRICSFWLPAPRSRGLSPRTACRCKKSRPPPLSPLPIGVHAQVCSLYRIRSVHRKESLLYLECTRSTISAVFPMYAFYALQFLALMTRWCKAFTLSLIKLSLSRSLSLSPPLPPTSGRTSYGTSDALNNVRERYPCRGCNAWDFPSTPNKKSSQSSFSQRVATVSL